MARTLNGNLTGRAASTYRRDILQEISDAEYKKIHEIWQQREDDAIQCCIAIEGPDAFIEWYMNNDNVPEYGAIVDRVNLIREHHQQLVVDARYTKVDRLAGEECANPIKIADIAETMEKEDDHLR